MSRYAKDNRPHIKPVEKIQLSQENVALRTVAAVLFLIIGAAALAFAFSQLFTADTGWQTIEAGTSEGATCADDFTLLYELGAEGGATAENRALTQLYTQACRTAFQLFHTMESFEGMTNLRDINAHPNETLTVDRLLYAAFETVQRCGDRTVYLGPVYARYGGVFHCTDDSQLVDFDPYLSDEVRAEYAAMAAYAADPSHIEVELLGDDQICLRVSEEYLAYAGEEDIDCFLDFGWMKNAFITDYLADTLAEAGFTHGVLSSYDGFARCLDGRDTGFTLNLFGWEGNRPIEAGTMQYQGPMSMVSLRAFPVTQEDWQRFYQRKDGRLRTSYLDPADGKYRQSVDTLVCWAKEEGCAWLTMTAASVFIAEEFDPAPLDRAAEEGIYALWCEDRVFSSTDRSLTIQNLYQLDGVSYIQARS